MSLATYLHQTASCLIMLKTAEGKPVLDGYGVPSFSPSVDIYVRREDVVKEVRDANGEIVKISREYFTSHSLQVGDRLDGLQVIAVEPYVGLGGRIYGYCVSV